MIERKYKRSALRSPMNCQLIYCWKKAVGVSKTLNISKTGILIKAIDGIKVGEIIDVIIEIPSIPLFSKLESRQIYALKNSSFDRQIVKLKVRIVRLYKGPVPFGEQSLSQMGGEFVHTPSELSLKVESYVDTYKKNLALLLNLMADLGQGKNYLPLLGHTSYLLGYHIKNNLGLLRQKVLHDYQSLESL
jgi:hypothetical protein